MKILPNTIFFFHEINNIDRMEKIIKFLKNHYNIISIQELENYFYGKQVLENCCHITFDDGHKSFYKIIFPLLVKYKIPASIFVSPYIIKNTSNYWFQEIKNYNEKKLYNVIKKLNLINTKNSDPISSKILLKNMTIKNIWNVIEHYRIDTGASVMPSMNINTDQLLEVHKSGLVSIGAHTMNHPILSNEDKETVNYEIRASIHDLSNLLNKEVKYFAYPNGKEKLDFTSREMEILKKANIKLGFSTEHKGFEKQNNPLNIPRDSFFTNNTALIFIKNLLGRNWSTLTGLVKRSKEKQLRTSHIQY